MRYSYLSPHSPECPALTARTTLLRICLRVDAKTLLPRKLRGRFSPEEVGLHVRHYEMMVILDPELEERTVAPSLDQFLSIVKTDGGTVDKVDIWGRRRLTYEINKRTDGIYAVVDLQCTPETVAELDRQLNINESVMRTKVIRPEIR
ncbi:ribosomal protein S6 [Antricoccus suffuscus]|uniref:Small ribosomal subunit protein bS6 n=1 Tax=Antricoccus suffuscus TaxID=1629062 RepID=A0A2T0ZYS4_9ACTN|nr:ribosomal protein S6 [Antricoccus suffuscus]